MRGASCSKTHWSRDPTPWPGSVLAQPGASFTALPGLDQPDSEGLGLADNVADWVRLSEDGAQLESKADFESHTSVKNENLPAKPQMTTGLASLSFHPGQSRAPAPRLEAPSGSLPRGG